MSTSTRTTSWKNLRADRVHSGQLDEADIAHERAEIAAEARAYRLTEIRKSLGLTQKDMATRIGVGQSRISAIESGDLTKVQVGTLAAYVEALGAGLEVSVRVGDEVRILSPAA